MLNQNDNNNPLPPPTPSISALYDFYNGLPEEVKTQLNREFKAESKRTSTCFSRLISKFPKLCLYGSVAAMIQSAFSGLFEVSPISDPGPLFVFLAGVLGMKLSYDAHIHKELVQEEKRLSHFMRSYSRIFPPAQAIDPQPAGLQQVVVQINN